MRIGLFSDTYHPIINGVTFVLDTTRRELEKQGHEVYIFAPAPGVRYKATDPYIIRFPAIKDILFKGQLTSLFFPPIIEKRIVGLKLDVIHFFTPAQVGLMGAYTAIRNNIPLVTTYCTDMHEYVIHYPQVLPAILAFGLITPVVLKTDIKEFKTVLSAIRPESSVTAWNKKMVVKLLTLLHNKCDAVIVPSLKMHKQLKSWKTKSPIYLLPDTVEPLKVDSKDANRLRKKLKVPSKDSIVLYVGRLGPEKNLEFLIKAAAVVLDKEPGVTFLIVGDHEHKQNLEQLTKELGVNRKFRFTGFVPRQKLGAYYKLADVFAFPSRTDTQGLVLHEAAASGLPLVLVDPLISGVFKSKKNGLLSINEPAHFAKCLIEIIGNQKLRSRMGKMSLQYAKQLSPVKRCEKLVDIYLSVMNKRD